MTPISEANRLEQFGALALVALGTIAVIRLILWVRRLPVSADPWDQKTAETLTAAETSGVCHKCSQPHSDNQPFCEHCGAAVGDYNNVLPYVYIFSQGEVLRTGATGTFRVNAMTIGGYLIYSLSCYLIFAPIYWYLLFRNIQRIKAEEGKTTATA